MIPAAFPLQAPAPQVSDYLQTIIDNKVSEVGLTCFQSFVHWFLTTFPCIYPSYDRLYRHQCDQVGRIKQIFGGTEVQDLTAGKIASVITEHRTNANDLAPQPEDFEYLGLNGKKILFNGNSEAEEIILWHPRYRPQIERIVMEDIPQLPGQFRITFYPNGVRSQATVDTNKVFLKRPQLTAIRPMRMPEHVYVTEEAIPHITVHSNYLKRI